MNFVSYPRLILLISGQTFEVTVGYENFWKLNTKHLCLTCPFIQSSLSNLQQLPHHNSIADWWEAAARSITKDRRRWFNGLVIYTAVSHVEHREGA